MVFIQKCKNRNATKMILSDIMDKIGPLKSARYHMIFKNKRNFRTFKHSNHKSTVFQVIQGPEKALMNFKYFQALQEPVGTLL